MVKTQSSEITVGSPDPRPPLFVARVGLGRSAVRHGPTTLQEHNSGQGSGDGNDLYDDFIMIQRSCRSMTWGYKAMASPGHEVP